MPPEQQEWRRLDPLMLLVHPVNELVRFFPLVLATLVFGASGEDRGPWRWLGIAVPIALGVGRFVTTRYRITAEQIELRRGLVSRSILTARLDRVRTVEVTSTPIHRLLGLARVSIGTGSAARGNDDRLQLDGLGIRQARTLRAALLHRADPAEPSTDASGAVGLPPPAEAADRLLLRFDPGWVRYAPLTSSGVVIAAALAALVGQLLDATGDQLTGWSLPQLPGSPWWVLLPLGLVVAGVVLAALSILGYLVANGGYRLTVDAAGRSFHVVRGLVTTRETSLERERIRGLTLHEPLAQRLVGAARLDAAVTGLDRRSGGSALLTPTAPAHVVTSLGTGMLDGSPALVVPLRRHGPRALRRRYYRAAAGLALPLVVAAVLSSYDAGWRWALVPTALLLLGAEPLARDRYRRLGHHLDERFLVVSSGTFTGSRMVLERDGIIGWNIQQSWFQRRAGLCDLVATTSAGRQSCTAYDVPEPVAVALAEAAVPGLVGQFRSPPPAPA